MTPLFFPERVPPIILMSGAPPKNNILFPLLLTCGCMPQFWHTAHSYSENTDFLSIILIIICCEDLYLFVHVLNFEDCSAENQAGVRVCLPDVDQD